MKKAIFTIDCHPSYYVGYTNGLRWNGWEMPFFDKKTVNRILAELTSEERDSNFHWEGDTLIENDRLEGESYPIYATEINGEMHYQVGNGWVWEEVCIKGEIAVIDCSGRGYRTKMRAIDYAFNNLEEIEAIEWLDSQPQLGDTLRLNAEKLVQL